MSPITLESDTALASIVPRSYISIHAGCIIFDRNDGHDEIVAVIILVVRGIE